eukprot:CAMPEP_0117426822 /NCGR_PEP_ID=MMETSP0758-20121206/6830_1 /TAXON_ID=63605 /ORGANISM="Percolomonas cosmopolitus, Strain AE-1 (ATCC 50343)" /LENGTH=464 /DNA_ID=CAMNT_0005212163 /DNA_START=63 /DNA_END=1454 /DNA_ORIENTATION=+
MAFDQTAKRGYSPNRSKLFDMKREKEKKMEQEKEKEKSKETVKDEKDEEEEEEEEEEYDLVRYKTVPYPDYSIIKSLENINMKKNLTYQPYSVRVHTDILGRAMKNDITFFNDGLNNIYDQLKNSNLSKEELRLFEEKRDPNQRRSIAEMLLSKIQRQQKKADESTLRSKFKKEDLDHFFTEIQKQSTYSQFYMTAKSTVKSGLDLIDVSPVHHYKLLVDFVLGKLIVSVINKDEDFLATPWKKPVTRIPLTVDERMQIQQFKVELFNTNEKYISLYYDIVKDLFIEVYNIDISGDSFREPNHLYFFHERIYDVLMNDKDIRKRLINAGKISANQREFERTYEEIVYDAQIQILQEERQNYLIYELIQHLKEIGEYDESQTKFKDPRSKDHFDIFINDVHYKVDADRVYIDFHEDYLPFSIQYDIFLHQLILNSKEEKTKLNDYSVDVLEPLLKAKTSKAWPVW